MLGAILPLIGVAADATYLTITKVFLRRYGKFTGRELIWFLFVAVIIVLLFTLPFTWHTPTWDTVKHTFPWLLGSITLACIHNLLFYWGIEHEKISNLEPLLLFSPLAGILIAGIFFPHERFWQVYVAVIISSLALLWSHYSRHRVALSDGLMAIFAYVAISGLEIVFIRRLLDFYDPLMLYFIRCCFVLAGLTFVIKPRLSLIKPHHLPYFSIMGILVAVSVWASYSAFKLRGISETLAVFTLSPILIYWLSVVFLKDKWQARNVIASLVILGLVVWVTLLK